jgi:cell division protein FtsW (lipid II flippase)
VSVGPLAVPSPPPPPPEPAVPKRRNVELLMVLFAVAITMSGYLIIGLTQDGKVPADTWQYGFVLTLLGIAAHLAVRKFAPYADPLILPLSLFINGLGIILIHRLDLAQVPGNGHDDARTQLIFTAIGVVVFAGIIIAVRDHRMLQRYMYISMLVGIILIALPAVLPASMSEVNGARSWIRAGGFSIQPAEFSKLLLASFFAAFLVQKRDALALASRRVLGLYLPRGRDLGPILVCWAVAMGIMVRETDLGVSLLFFGIFVVMLYIATERTSWLLFGLLLFVGGAFVANLVVAHVHARVVAWLHPFSDPLGTTFQASQALFGFATGGILGTGLDQGHSYFVQFAFKADYILVTVGEELGLAGVMALFLAYALIVVRGFKTALTVRDSYGKLFAGGLSVVFALEVFITAGGVMDLIPLTGLPLPFLAQGGSALVSNWMLIALLMRMSDAGRRPVPPARRLPDAEAQVVRT